MELVQKQDIAYEWRKIGMDDTANEVIVHEIVERTIEHLRASIKSVISVSNVKEHIKSHFDSALQQYFEYRDDPRQFDKYKFVLIGQLKNAFSDFCLEYRNKCSAYLSEAVQSFRSEADTLIKSKCLPQDNLNNILTDVKATVVQQYEESAGTDLDQLNKRLDEEAEVYVSENNNRLAQIYVKYNSILVDLLELYDQFVEIKLPDEYLETASKEKLESAFNFCKDKVLFELNKAMQFDVPEMKSMFENRIVEVLHKRFASKIESSNSLKEQKLKEAADVVRQAVDSFEKSLTESFAKTSNASELENHRKAKRNELIVDITAEIYEILPDRKVAKQMLERARENMKQVFDDLQNQRLAQEETFRKQWDDELNSICETFNERFNELCEPALLLGLEDLRKERKIIISDLIRKISWLNAHKKTDLLESFKNTAKQQMTNMSEPTLER